MNPALLGITLDVPATVEAAFRQGHGEGGLAALLNRVQIAPVVSVDAAVMQSELERTANTFAVPALNAGVELVNGSVQATEPQVGRVLNISATIAAVQADPGAVLADGSLGLVMSEVTPTVLDSSPLV
ncbi:MAG: peptidoglycan binding domain-containing protein, partial [Anaerolineae bacterium]|nr:peptidoglycan binding domain-containing protein [Anaerolineae bacterium]